MAWSLVPRLHCGWALTVLVAEPAFAHPVTLRVLVPGCCWLPGSSMWAPAQGPQGVLLAAESLHILQALVGSDFLLGAGVRRSRGCLADGPVSHGCHALGVARTLPLRMAKPGGSSCRAHLTDGQAEGWRAALPTSGFTGDLRAWEGVRLRGVSCSGPAAAPNHASTTGTSAPPPRPRDFRPQRHSCLHHSAHPNILGLQLLGGGVGGDPVMQRKLRRPGGGGSVWPQDGAGHTLSSASRPPGPSAAQHAVGGS